MMVFGMNENAKMVNIKYVMIDVASSYNIIMGRPALKILGVTLLILYLPKYAVLIPRQEGKGNPR